MKVTPSDLLHLFSEPRPSAEGAPLVTATARQVSPAFGGTSAAPPVVELEAAPTAQQAIATAPLESPPSRVEAGFTTLHREIATALPALWLKARKQQLTRAEERKKLRALLSWLVSKKGLKSQEGAPMRYRHGADLVDGKVDLLVRDQSGGALLAVEADWTRQEASLEKLKAAHEKGIPVMWILGTSVKSRQEAKESRKYALKHLGREAGNWLVIFHLEHGWL